MPAASDLSAVSAIATTDQSETQAAKSSWPARTASRPRPRPTSPARKAGSSLAPLDLVLTRRPPFPRLLRCEQERAVRWGLPKHVHGHCRERPQRDEGASVPGPSNNGADEHRYDRRRE